MKPLSLMQRLLEKQAQHKQGGFAITFEVLMSLLMLFMIFNMTLYSLYAMNVKDTICTLTSQSLVQASRWGGFGSQAYAQNAGVPGLTIQKQLQNEFDLLKPSGGLSGNSLLGVYAKVVAVSPTKSITYNGQEVSIKVSYSLPTNANMKDYIGIFSGKQTKTITMAMPAVMQSGKLLG